MEESRRDERLAANVIYNLAAVNSVYLGRNSIAITASMCESSFTLFNSYTIIVLIINIFTTVDEKLTKAFRY